MKSLTQRETPCQNEISKYRIAQLQRITEIDQFIITELFPGEYEPIKLPLQQRASYKIIPYINNHNNYSAQKIEVCQRIFEEQYNIFEATHIFWDFNCSLEQPSNFTSSSDIYNDHQTKSIMQNNSSQLMNIENCSKEAQIKVLNKNYSDSKDKYSMNQKVQSKNLNSPIKEKKELSFYSLKKEQDDNQIKNQKNTYTKQEYIKQDLFQFDQEVDPDKSFSLSSFKSDLIQNINEHEQQEIQINQAQNIYKKIKLESTGLNDSTKNLKQYSKIEYESDDSAQNLKFSFSKKKTEKIQKKTKERQKRSKYYERMAIKDQSQNEGEENNETYLQSKDVILEGIHFETFGVRNRFVNSSHWIFGDSNYPVEQRQQKADDFLQSFLNQKEKIFHNNHLKRIEILNVCSFIIQSSQIHKDMQKYFLDSEKLKINPTQHINSPIQRNIFASNSSNKPIKESNKSSLLNFPSSSFNYTQTQESTLSLNNNQDLQKNPSQQYNLIKKEQINALDILRQTKIFYSRHSQIAIQSKQEDLTLKNQVQNKNLIENIKSEHANNPESTKKIKTKSRLQTLLEQNLNALADKKNEDLCKNEFKQQKDSCVSVKKEIENKHQIILKEEEEELQFKKNQQNFNFQMSNNQIIQKTEVEIQLSENSMQMGNELNQLNDSNAESQNQNKNIPENTNKSKSQMKYLPVINQFFNLSFKNRSVEGDFDFNNIKTSKSIYSNTDPTKKQFGIEVMVVNSDEEEVQIERIKKNYGKFHNFNKLFMYNVVKMFQECNLDNLGVPSMVISEILNIVNKIKISARRRNNSNKEVQYDYFSIAHYNLLFFLIKNSNTEIIKDQFEYIHFYKKCFQINIDSESNQGLSIIYANIIKRFCFLIYMNSIQKSYDQANQASQKTPRQEYILKATEGIQNLHQGNLVRRF